MKPTRTDHFCHATWWPSTVKLAPSGWVIEIGFRSGRGASKCGTLSGAAIRSTS